MATKLYAALDMRLVSMDVSRPTSPHPLLNPVSQRIREDYKIYQAD